MNPEDLLNSNRKKSIDDIGVVRPHNLQEAIDEQKKAEGQSAIKAIKTYQSDVAEAIKRDNVSVIKMALAEKKRQEKAAVIETKVKTESKKSIVFVLLSIILILGGLSALSIFYFWNRNSSSSITAINAKSIIYAEKTTDINLDNLDLPTFLTKENALKNIPIENASVENILLSKTSTASSSVVKIGSNVAVTSPEFIDFLGTTIPPPFLRSLKDEFMLGFYQNSSAPETFLILKTDSYENAFAGMLSWEKNLPYDLQSLFTLNSSATITAAPLASSSAVSASSSTTTIPTARVVVPTSNDFKAFSDKVIANRDTRVLTDQSGKIIFLYSFIDPETIVMTTSENGFREILSRYIQGGHEK